MAETPEASPLANDVVQLQEFTRLLDTVVGSEGWAKLVKPAAVNLRNTYNLALIDGKIENNAGTPISIEQCRAIIKTLDWVIEWEVKRSIAAEELRKAVEVLASTEEFTGGSPLAKQPAEK